MYHNEQLGIAIQKKRQIIELLDQLCQRIEITSAQFQTAKSRYKAVGTWLAEGGSIYLGSAQIYPQGSIALGTTVKPLAAEEFDVDLVCYLPLISTSTESAAVKQLIGSRLRENATYKGMLEEKKRCWRINYANEFHLDITPSIKNPHCCNAGELVPDKTLSSWKPTNPKGYLTKFEERASITPRLLLLEERQFGKTAMDSIETLPEPTASKPLLKRVVQLLKRHRDQRFVGSAQADLAPISVILTTLASRAYEKCAAQLTHASAFDFIIAMIREMPSFIRIDYRNGKPYYTIENETTTGENFADKWNSDERLVEAFFAWYQDVISSIESLLHLEGADQFADILSTKFGAKKENIRDAFTSLTTPINQARSSGLLAVAPEIGLVTAPVSLATAVPRNTFYGCKWE